MIAHTTDKHIIVIAGPNGSGKTTVAREFIDNQNIRYISADDIAYEISHSNPLSARVQAGKLFFSRLDEAVTFRKLPGMKISKIMCLTSLYSVPLRKW